MIRAPYDPAAAPFEMPLVVGRFTLALAHPAEAPSADLAIWLRGALLRSLRVLGCARRKAAPGTPHCPESPDPPASALRVACAEPGACLVPWLYKPRSLFRCPAHLTAGSEVDARGERCGCRARDHAAPVSFTLEPDASPLRPRGRYVLWGRRATSADARRLVAAALEAAGRSGLGDPRGERTAFEVEPGPVFEGTLGRWVQLSSPAHLPSAIEVELATPCRTTAAGLAAVAGNAAHDVVQWDLVDRGIEQQHGPRGCDALADDARATAREAIEGLTVAAESSEVQSAGSRRSTGGHRHDLTGLTARFRLCGDVGAAFPWLALLALRGAGEKRSFGLGQVRLWLPADGPGEAAPRRSARSKEKTP